MFDNLLVDNLPNQQIVVTVGIAVAVLVVLYGALRRFSRQSWIGWQTVIVVALISLLKLIPVPQGEDGKITYLATVLGCFFGMLAVVLIVGRLVRTAFEQRKLSGKRSGGGIFLDALLGVFTFALNIVVFFVAVGGVVLLVAQCMTDGAFATALDPVYTFELGGFCPWTFFKEYVMDVFFTFFMLFCLKGSYRLGLLKGIWAIVCMALTAAALVGAFWLTFNVGFMGDIVDGIAQNLARIGDAARLVGVLIVAGVTLILFLILLTLVNLILGSLIRRMDDAKPFRFLDGAILTVLTFTVVVGASYGLYYGISALGTVENEAVAGVLNAFDFEAFFTSSFFTKFLYEYNPLAWIVK